jgi:hypothetical protein
MSYVLCWLYRALVDCLQGNSTPPPETDTEYSSRSKSSPVSSAGQILAPAVDMQQLAGQPNTFVVCVPGLHSSDQTTRKMAQRLAGTIARELLPQCSYCLHGMSVLAVHAPCADTLYTHLLPTFELIERSAMGCS